MSEAGSSGHSGAGEGRTGAWCPANLWCKRVHLGSTGQMGCRSLLVPKDLSPMRLRAGSGASFSSDRSWSFWHKECGFQKKPGTLGLQGCLSLKPKPVGMCCLGRGLNPRPKKVIAIPSMSTAWSFSPGRPVPWLGSFSWLWTLLQWYGSEHWPWQCGLIRLFKV